MAANNLNTGGFSIARDLSATLTSNGITITLPKMTAFDPEAVWDSYKSKVMDGPTRALDVADGHNITMSFDREDSTLDDLFATLENLFYGSGVHPPLFTLYVTINELDGSISEYEYSELSLQYKAGGWKPGSPVAQQLKGFARFMTKVSV